MGICPRLRRRSPPPERWRATLSVHENAAFVGDDKDFKGLTQFGIELSVAGLNRLFRDSKDKTAAAKIDFKYENETFSWNMWDVLKSLFKNGYVERLEEDFEKS